MKKPLQKELERFKALLPSLLSSDEGKFAVIYGDDLIGVFGTYEDALTLGYEKCGVKPFLVKRISAVETPLNFTRRLVPCHT